MAKGMDSAQEARSRYQPNAEGRKEREGFVCSSGTMKWFNCVAVKRDAQGVHLRDTKDVADATLSFTDDEWRIFVKGVKDGEFDV